MNQKVKLRILGLQDERANSDAENLRGAGAGIDAEYFQKDGKHYLMYEEVLEGHDTVSKCRMKFYDNYLELVRRGTVQTRMVFETGVCHNLNYQTPFGCLAMEINTQRVLVEEHDNEIKIAVDYALTTEGEGVSDCQIVIHIWARM